MSQINDRPNDQVKLLVLESNGELRHDFSQNLINLFHENDVVIANAAATLPASLNGTHINSGQAIEIRLAGWEVLGDYSRFHAIAFGQGDYRTPTEYRMPAPTFAVGDRLVLGPLNGVVAKILNHPRLIAIDFIGSQQTSIAGLARHGRPIQYSHVTDQMALWDVWTGIAARPTAFEPPSAGFALDWALLQSLQDKNIGFGTLHHAAGISSSGSSDLDQLLPLDEHYCIPSVTAALVNDAKIQGGRIIAIGTTVMRALEAAADAYGIIHAGDGIAHNRIDRQTTLRCVDALLTGIHPPGTSHHDLMNSLVSDTLLLDIDQLASAHRYREHEFGDLLFLQGIDDCEHHHAA